jgi:hypothetical protein
MDYDINIITRKHIPSNIYLCSGFDKDWEMIHSFEFENGLQFIIGSNHPISSPELILEDMKQELECVLNNETVGDLQDYYYNNFENFINYNDCYKIWNYYNNNKHLIMQVINAFNDSDDEGFVDDL